MQIAARTAVYSPARELMGRIVFLAMAEDKSRATVIESRIIESQLVEFPDLQGAIIDLSVADGELPPVTVEGELIGYLNGEAAQFHKTDAAAHYISLCKESHAHPPEP